MWPLGDDDTRQQMSVMATAAAWGLNQWESMEEYVRCIPKDSFDGAFYQSLLNIHNQCFIDAQKVSYVHVHVHVSVSLCELGTFKLE